MITPIFLEVAVVVIGAFLLLYEAFVNDRQKNFLGWTAISGLSLVLVLSFFTKQPAETGAAYWNLYTADALAMFFKRFALLTTIAVLIMSLEYRNVIRNFIFGGDTEAGLGEFYSIPVFTCAGLMWMASAIDFTLIFVSLELVTISFYVLVSYMRRNTASLEAGVKYLILGALSTGLLVYGITWIFGITGETNLAKIAAKLPQLAGVSTPLLFGIVLVMIALGFKIAAAPFQFWVPDVYQGAPTPITAYLSVGSKAAGFVVLMRVLHTFTTADFVREKMTGLLAILAIATLIYGNLAALPQDNFKRLLAYSSIAHAGYLLMPLAGLGAPDSEKAVVVYLAGYLLMTILGFMVVTIVSSHANGDDIARFNGLGRRSPFLAFALLVAMASLAGVPLTVGFMGKFLAFFVAIEKGLWLLVGVGVITVAAGFYYYLKVVRAMYWQAPSSDAPITVLPLTKIAICALIGAIFLFGLWPQPIFTMLQPGQPGALALR